MASLHTIIEKLSSISILVIGDMMLDHYIWGDVHRISPEAPVPIVHAERDTYTAGGAANVALNLSNLAVATTLVGYRGNDEAGTRLEQILKEYKIETFKNTVQDTVPTIIKTRVIVRGQQLCRIDREAKLANYRIEETPDFEQSLYQMLRNAQAVIISDYAKGVVTQSLMDKLLNYTADNPHLLVALDPKPSRKIQFKGVGLMTPNKSEALQLAGIDEPYPGTTYPLEEVCRRIQELYEPKQLVITLGADGMAICSNNEVVRLLPTQAKEVFDVSGAGDTVIATLTAALAAGADIVDAAHIANLAAACVVSHIGTAPVKLEELKQKILTEPKN